MPFESRVNDALLYRGSDGREAWVSIDWQTKEAAIVTFTEGQNCALFSVDALRTIVEMLESPGTPCPACGKPSEYYAVVDRYYHRDRSPMEDCWTQILRGDTPSD